MALNEQYLLYKFADHLVKHDQFELLYINEETNEILLEKRENRISTVVRLAQKGFDWKNHLKRDISMLFQRVMNAKRLFGKKVDVYNLYFTTYAPVDTWEVLKQPLNSQGKPNIRMKVYYLDEEDYSEEASRFQNDLLQAPIDYDMDLPSEAKENLIEIMKQDLIHHLKNKKNKLQNIFTFGKPLYSYIFIALNILYFIWIESVGSSTSVETLIQYGAKYNPAILLDGEWWRLVSSMFIHIGFLHLALNMLALFYLGTAAERIFGNGRFIFIYFIAGIGGSLASFAFSATVSAGASGAIFGLFGAFLYFGCIHRRLFFQTMGTSIILILAINLVIGLSMEQIDMAAHVGGLVAGFLAAAIVGLPKNKQKTWQIGASILLVILAITVTMYGVEANENSQSFQVIQIQEHLERNEFATVVELTTNSLSEEVDGELESALLFQRSYAYIELDRYEEAVIDLEKSVSTAEPLPEAFYNLALLYEADHEIERAIEVIEEGYQLFSTHRDIMLLYEKLTEESIQ